MTSWYNGKSCHYALRVASVIQTREKIDVSILSIPSFLPSQSCSWGRTCPNLAKGLGPSTGSHR